MLKEEQEAQIKDEDFFSITQKATSSKLSDYHDLQIRELDQEIHTVTT